MKGFQFYVVKSFPELELNEPIVNQVQATISGDLEDVSTSITLTQRNVNATFSRLRFQTKIKHTEQIFVKQVSDGCRRTLEFQEYLKPAEFSAYLDESRKILFFQSSKKVTRAVVSNLRKTERRIKLTEMMVDFKKVKTICPNLKTVWVKNVNSRLKQVTMSGDQLEHDSLYKGVSNSPHSGMILRWLYDQYEHQILVSLFGSIGLVNTYKSPKYELDLVMDVYERLLSKVWYEKPERRA